jgi:hypothetical protein
MFVDCNQGSAPHNQSHSYDDIIIWAGCNWTILKPTLLDGLELHLSRSVNRTSKRFPRNWNQVFNSGHMLVSFRHPVRKNRRRCRLGIHCTLFREIDSSSQETDSEGSLESTA